MYKIVLFFPSNTNAATEAKEMVMLELLKLPGEKADKQGNQDEPPARKPCRAQASSRLDSVFDEIADEQASTLNRAPVGTVTVKQ